MLNYHRNRFATFTSCLFIFSGKCDYLAPKLLVYVYYVTSLLLLEAMNGQASYFAFVI
jgi:hypothetical protein